ITRRLSSIQTTDNNTTLSSINYTYDLVGNVTQVASTCPWLPNQNFTETFTYDSTDQLLTAQESQNNGYQLAVNYGNWGKIMQYDLTQTDMLNNATSQISRSLTYPSHANNVGNSQTPFAPTMQNGDEDVFFTFGINGSLRKREVQTPNPYNEYFLFNSQNNLKAYSDDVMSFAYYGYNAANTRTYKLSLYNTNVWINGQQQPLNLQLQQAMFYPNTYLNFDAFGNYTKHYYNGMERIASRLGDNTTTIAINNNILEDRKLQLEEQFREDIHKLIEETVPIDLPPFIDVNTLQPTGTPNDIYYYHPNHLGSTAFVTNNNATITQGFLYAPFGEITTEYNINFGNNGIPKYSFNAKELDEETGMYYYEARYYKPPVFTSRDPLFEKYPTFSPYTYCANNPVKYVDPSGCEIGDYYDLNGKWLGRDRNTDNIAYTATSVSKDADGFVISASNKETLPISNSELLDRATWVCGESRGSDEKITNRVQNKGDATKTSDATVAEYYAAAINNMSTYTKGGFYQAIKIRMSRKNEEGTIVYTSSGYFTGEKGCGNSNSRAFAEARKNGMDHLNKETRFTNSIAAVIKSVQKDFIDPTGGCRAWLGENDAKKYYDNGSISTKSAAFQFSFQSNNGKFYHTFYRH
ncbi:MAG: RHS repeat-associated core domain-containing protein, partial [Bacteroidales bacterium]|nr:RHS repeat-associated core domain-containing protein [Bacteroidales bacterium]